MANDMMMAFAKDILGQTDHLDDKLNFLKLPATKDYFYAYLKCFICGMSCQKVREIFDRGGCSAEDIGKLMIEDLVERNREEGSGGQHRERKEEEERLRLQMSEMETALKEMEHEKSRLEEAIVTKDHVQSQMREKIEQMKQYRADLEKENERLRKGEQTVKEEKDPVKEPAQEEKSSEGRRGKGWMEEMRSFFAFGKGKKAVRDPKTDRNRFVEDELARESFRTEVLLNKKFSKEQKDYLFSLLERGESYVNIRPFASPNVSVEDMKRYYRLCKGGKD